MSQPLNQVDINPGHASDGEANSIYKSYLTWIEPLYHRSQLRRFTFKTNRNETRTQQKPRNHKDLEAQQQIEARLNSTKRVYKNSTRAKMNGTTSQKAMNPVIANMYHVILKKVKELYSTLPNKEDRVIILLNNELDPTDSHGLFTLITPSFFFYLECDIMNNYRIEFLFHLCPFEEEIQQLINVFSMKSYSTQVVKEEDYSAFFNRCMSCQPPRFIHQL